MQILNYDPIKLTNAVKASELVAKFDEALRKGDRAVNDFITEEAGVLNRHLSFVLVVFVWGGVVFIALICATYFLNRPLVVSVVAI